MVQLSIQAVNNCNLFSNHYLEDLIRKNDEWRSNDHEAVFDEIKKIYDAEKPFFEDLNESQLEERFFRRIFKIMLPDFEVQAGTESQEFEGSLRKLRPLIERIERTDWLVDPVVYRLYGLSDEEVRVVENG